MASVMSGGSSRTTGHNDVTMGHHQGDMMWAVREVRKQFRSLGGGGKVTPASREGTLRHWAAPGKGGTVWGLVRAPAGPGPTMEDQIISFQSFPLSLQSVFHCGLVCHCILHLPWVVRTLGFPIFIGVPHQLHLLPQMGQEHRTPVSRPVGGGPSGKCACCHEGSGCCSVASMTVSFLLDYNLPECSDFIVVHNNPM